MLSASTQTTGYDIYLSKNYIPKQYLIFVVFHKVTEATLTSQGQDGKQAHNTAKELDEQFAKSELSQKEFNEYLEYKTKIHVQ